ncbi:hypothetical protein HDU81_009243 [Chytriomyces hyalinus]|nr:hypothetical protein HDU81_009243 [Chytriomyces hyalinus]
MPPQANVRFGRQLPVGRSSFNAVMKENCTFVDKSMLIVEVIESGTRVILIIRPRRFGKSMNLSMLKAFFEILVNHQGVAEPDANRNLFQGLLIEQNEPDLFEADGPFGRHPVISLDLKVRLFCVGWLTFRDSLVSSCLATKGITEKTWEKMFSAFRTLLAETYGQFKYLLESPHLDDDEKALFRRIISNDESVDKADLTASLQRLSEFLTRHHGRKCVILVDEYDTLLECAGCEGFLKSASKFFGSMLSELLKGNDKNVFKAVLVGIRHTPNSDFRDRLNNLKVYTFNDHEFSDKFGFTSQEVDLLLKKRRRGLDVTAVKSWYNGYQSANGLEVYNPWSILCTCSDGMIQNYWVETGGTDRIQELLESRELVKLQLE